jgi:citrate synthase
MKLSNQEVHKGLEGIIADTSSICDVEDEKGLIYRGFSIDDLSENALFEEVAYLLLFGKLPDAQELENFISLLSQERDIPEDLLSIIRKLPQSSNIMDVLKASISILALYDPDVSDNSRNANIRKAIRLIAKTPTIITASYRIFQGKEPIQPDLKLSHTQNFFSMLNGKVPKDFIVKVLNVSLILYAEHEFNASTFSARVTASTLSDMYSAITSAIGTLKGPLHGGANEKVMEMILEIGEVDKVEIWIKNALARKERIMGFGHRVYKKGDSRSGIIKKFSKELGEYLGQGKWYRISCIIEDVMLREKGLYPNLDFYSATALYQMGIPIELFTPVFVASRITGWTAHVIEQHENNRLIRPRCLYTGPRGLRYPKSK